MTTRLFFTTLFLSFGLLFTGCESQETEPSDATETNDTQTDSQQESWSVSSQYVDLQITEVADDFRNPWSVAFLPDGRMLVTERAGQLTMLEDGEKREITGLPEVHVQGQGGLLDVSLHPDFESNGWVYLTFSKPNDEEQTATALIRAQIEDYSLVNLEELFVQDRYSEPGRHYGSRLAWTLDGKLLMSVGERGADPPRAQDLGDHAGSLLRLNDDGSIPDDNPFVDDDNAHNEIYSYGHRNIQGLVVHPETGEIWATEHGPRGSDELNRIEAGNNYGWPIVTLGLDYGTQEQFPHSEARTMEGMVDPIYEFLPTHAPSGLAVVTNDHFTSYWEENFLAGGLVSQRIRRLVLNEEKDVVLHDEELLLHEIGRIRDVRIGPDNNLYVLNDHPQGSLWRVEPAE